MRSRELQYCQWATLADLEIFSQIGICLLFASEYHCLHLCITLIPGEYRINCISLLIHSILRYSGFYIGEAVPSAESYKGDLWLWLVSSKPMSQLPPSQARTLPCTFPRATHMPSTIPCTFPALVARVSSYHLSGVIEACESGDPLHVV